MPKITLITGGSRGLGRNTALNVARRGGDVILTYHTNKAEADAVVAAIGEMGRKAVALPLDCGAIATFPAFVQAARETLAQTWGDGHIDALVNNAGTGLVKPIAEMTEALFDQLCDVHFKGVYFLTQALLPLIRDGGRIVNISSGLTRVSFPGSSAYAAMKGAVEVMTRYMAREFAGRGITANTVAPGAVVTDFNGAHLRNNENLRQVVASFTALGRVGEPDDIGPMVATLLSGANRWVTGQRIEASGGMVL
ncbi:MAG: SDR family oxidoreductase [Azospirillaceae bacterium]|nr:SDR family oxidoreductase [Azospirillaceae bacterium]